ncbi:hypothetical protein F1559_002002 [Cyanidiococcus yangmingshanensis]|uniref:Mediator of RNA polymerase II transcription subunit 10 n=1 Tax=Cyanidiococcus yangmingshanensis TaxID=2690220 RepID=A0A7J7ILT1_9RHOD|nr:hypothetical protein F1559_002002 [Cyanidiococcus yangmingshanensis]
MANTKEDVLEKSFIDCIALWEQLNRIAVCFREDSSVHGPAALSDAFTALQAANSNHHQQARETITKASAGPESWRVPLELLQWLDRGENPDLFLLRLLYDAVDLERIGAAKQKELKSFRAALCAFDRLRAAKEVTTPQQASSTTEPTHEQA